LEYGLARQKTVTSALSIRYAADVLHAGGIIAYPTEGVFGLGCMPDDAAAVEYLLAIKGRNKRAGLILIAADYELLAEWLAPSKIEKKRLTAGSAIPTTWIVTATPAAPDWLTGGRNTLAVRITTHPIAAALSRAADSALVSTSANRTGHRPAKSALQARRWFGNQLDYVVAGATTGASGPSEIRVAHSGKTIRPVKTTK
jgi:L-threonylcarbamoyladenylate synthase